MKMETPLLAIDYDEAKLLIKALGNSYFSLNQKLAGEDPDEFFSEREHMINRLKDYTRQVDKFFTKKRRMA